MTTNATDNPWAHRTAEAVTKEAAWRYQQIEANRAAWDRVASLVGSYARVRFGEASQVCYVHKVTKNGNVHITAYNASRERWYPNKRTVEPRDLIIAEVGRQSSPPFGIAPLAEV